jgi:hypothetical protein
LRPILADVSTPGREPTAGDLERRALTLAATSALAIIFRGAGTVSYLQSKAWKVGVGIAGTASLVLTLALVVAALLAHSPSSLERRQRRLDLALLLFLIGLVLLAARASADAVDFIGGIE